MRQSYAKKSNSQAFVKQKTTKHNIFVPICQYLPQKATIIRLLRQLVNTLAYYRVQFWPNIEFRKCPVIPSGINPVTQEYKYQPVIRVNPITCTGKTYMPESCSCRLATSWRLFRFFHVGLVETEPATRIRALVLTEQQHCGRL